MLILNTELIISSLEPSDPCEINYEYIISIIILLFFNHYYYYYFEVLVMEPRNSEELGSCSTA